MSSTVQIARRDKRLERDRHRCEIVCGSCSKIAPNRLVSSEFATQPEVTFHYLEYRRRVRGSCLPKLSGSSCSAASNCAAVSRVFSHSHVKRINFD
jgi:hypothetical protein